MRRLIKPLVALGLVIIAAISIVLAWRQHTFSATVSLDLAPRDAKVTINGHIARRGINKVRPGRQIIVATRPGFATHTETVTVQADESHSVGIVLYSNSPETANWYQTHPADQQEIEIISGKDFDRLTQQSTETTPLLKKLPYIGAGFEFRIDYGNQTGAKAGQPIIYITAPSEAAYQDALTWIKSQGFDVSKLTIRYIKGRP